MLIYSFIEKSTPIFNLTKFIHYLFLVLGVDSKANNVVIRKGNFQIKNYKNEEETSITFGIQCIQTQHYI